MHLSLSEIDKELKYYPLQFFTIPYEIVRVLLITKELINKSSFYLKAPCYNITGSPWFTLQSDHATFNMHTHHIKCDQDFCSLLL